MIENRMFPGSLLQQFAKHRSKVRARTEGTKAMKCAAIILSTKKFWTQNAKVYVKDSNSFMRMHPTLGNVRDNIKRIEPAGRSTLSKFLMGPMLGTAENYQTPEREKKG